jgi:transposase
MKRQIRVYDQAFQEQAIKLVTVQRQDPTSTARDLGIPTSTFFKWLYDRGWKKSFTNHGPASAPPDDPVVLKARITELERQVQSLLTDREILKKATAFFASQSK